jgi:hypothetical protein
MKPKIILCLALISAAVILGLCYSYTYLSAFLADYGPNYNPSALEVTMEIPAIQLPGQTRPTLNTLYNQQARDPDAHFDVKIKNVSSQPVFIWDASTLEADYALSFEITEAYIWTFKVEKRLMVNTAGNPFALHLLAPGETQVREIYYVGNWDPPFPFDANRDKTVTLRAVFEQKHTDLPVGAKIWTGRVVSEPCEVVLRKEAP